MSNTCISNDFNITVIQGADFEMEANIQDLKKDNSNTVYPTTKTTAVSSESGENLEENLSEKVAVVLSVTQHASQNDGDFWYKIIT